jgi:hypothetical protein
MLSLWANAFEGRIHMTILPKMFSIVAIMLSAEVALAAPVAIVNESAGQASVQTAEGIISASPGTQLSEGDRLAVGEGSVKVSYLRGKCKGAREIGPRTIAVISASEELCSKRIEGAKAQSTDTNLPDYVAPALVLAIGGGIAGALAATNNVGSGSVLPLISP